MDRIERECWNRFQGWGLGPHQFTWLKSEADEPLELADDEYLVLEVRLGTVPDSVDFALEWLFDAPGRIHCSGIRRVSKYDHRITECGPRAKALVEQGGIPPWSLRWKRVTVNWYTDKAPTDYLGLHPDHEHVGLAGLLLAAQYPRRVMACKWKSGVYGWWCPGLQTEIPYRTGRNRFEHQMPFIDYVTGSPRRTPAIELHLSDFSRIRRRIGIPVYTSQYVD